MYLSFKKVTLMVCEISNYDMVVRHVEKVGDRCYKLNVLVYAITP